MRSKLSLLPFIYLSSFACALPSYNQSVILTKTHTTSDGQTYTYTFAGATNASQPTLLLLHGYPASRHDWDIPIEALTAAGYGIVAPDLLGFGDSSKPTDVEAYNTKTLSGHIDQILEAENLPQVIGVGHDWGSGMLGKAVTWFPERFAKIVFVTTPYIPAGLLFDIDATNKAAVDEGNPMQFGYWYFFNSWDAGSIIETHLESFFHLVFATNSSSWSTDFADLGAARAWLNANRTTASPSWLPPSYKENWLREFSQPDIVRASLNWYRALMRGINAPDEAVLTDEDRNLRVPVLAIGSSRDVITSLEQQRASLEPWAKAGFEQRVVDAGHWATLERGEEVAEILIEFAGKK